MASNKFLFIGSLTCLHSLRSWAMYFTFARLRLAGKLIISPWVRLRQIICIGALITAKSALNSIYSYARVDGLYHIDLIDTSIKIQNFGKFVKNRYPSP